MQEEEMKPKEKNVMNFRVKLVVCFLDGKLLFALPSICSEQAARDVGIVPCVIACMYLTFSTCLVIIPNRPYACSAQRLRSE